MCIAINIRVLNVESTCISNTVDSVEHRVQCDLWQSMVQDRNGKILQKFNNTTGFLDFLPPLTKMVFMNE